MVIKNIGPRLSRGVDLTGATVLADGSIVTIVNPVQLAQREAASGVNAFVGKPYQEAELLRHIGACLVRQ